MYSQNFIIKRVAPRGRFCNGFAIVHVGNHEIQAIGSREFLTQAFPDVRVEAESALKPMDLAVIAVPQPRFPFGPEYSRGA